MNAFRGTMTATALVFVLSLAAARADPYVGTDDDGNLQLRSAQGQGVFANNVDGHHHPCDQHYKGPGKLYAFQRVARHPTGRIPGT